MHALPKKQCTTEGTKKKWDKEKDLWKWDRVTVLSSASDIKCWSRSRGRGWLPRDMTASAEVASVPSVMDTEEGRNPAVKANRDSASEAKKLRRYQPPTNKKEGSRDKQQIVAASLEYVGIPLQCTQTSHISHTHTHTLTHTHTHTRVHTHNHVYMYTYIETHTYIHTHTYKHIRIDKKPGFSRSSE